MDYNHPWQNAYPPVPPQIEPPLSFSAGKREVIFGLMILLSSLLLSNFTLYGGFNLGFAVGVIACIACSFSYLLVSGHKPTIYSGSLLFLSAVIATAFARSDDGFVKFVMVCFLLVSINLGLCLMAGQNLRPAGSIRSLLDAPRAAFTLGFGGLGPAFRGIGEGFHRSGNAGKKGGAFLLGLCLCVPVLAIMIPLLIRADAAFDGLMQMLPEFKMEEVFSTAMVGSTLCCVLYTRGTALHHKPKSTPKACTGKGIPTITVNTVLWAVCLLYVVYLLSQLAYLSGGFAGILPEGFSTAEYARRGFFEMSCLCGVNLTVTVLALGLIRKEKNAPLMTRILCLFICLLNLFLVATAGAKMFMYIGTYGLTRLRMLTQVIMLFMAVTTVVLAVWLFVPKLPYMRVVLLAALVLGAATIWADVNTQVAWYNVDAYLTGKHETVDVAHLNSLGNAAIEPLKRLEQEAPDPVTRKQAARYLEMKKETIDDFREWNYVNHKAKTQE